MKRSRILGALSLCCGFLLMGAQNNACTLLFGALEDPDGNRDNGTTVVSASCASDADCAEGQFCAVVLGEPDEGSSADAAAPDRGSPAVRGACVDRRGPNPCETVRCSADTHCEPQPDGSAACIPHDGGCFNDDECGGRGFCDFSVCGPSDSSGGGDPDPSVPERCRGTCQPYTNSCANVRCTADTACVETRDGPQCVPSGPACHDNQPCGDSGYCDLSPCASIEDNGQVVDECGVCRPYTNTCANVRCASDTVCVETADGPQCVPNRDPSPVSCTSSETCGPGQTCNADTLCLSDPSCAPGSDCTSVCWGYCENIPASCADGTGCRDDEVCADVAVCPPDSLVACLEDLRCIPKIRPCFDATQCLEGEYCSYADPPPPPPCPEGMACRAAPPPVPQGTCQPNP